MPFIWDKAHTNGMYQWLISSKSSRSVVCPSWKSFRIPPLKDLFTACQHHWDYILSRHSRGKGCDTPPDETNVYCKQDRQTVLATWDSPMDKRSVLFHPNASLCVRLHSPWKALETRIAGTLHLVQWFSHWIFVPECGVGCVHVTASFVRHSTAPASSQKQIDLMHCVWYRRSVCLTLLAPYRFMKILTDLSYQGLHI